jgi:hypothetical protein
MAGSAAVEAKSFVLGTWVLEIGRLLCLSYCTIDLRPPTVMNPCSARALKPSPPFPVFSASCFGHSMHITMNSFYVVNDMVVISIALFSPKRPEKEEGWNFKNRRFWLGRLVRSPL